MKKELLFLMLIVYSRLQSTSDQASAAPIIYASVATPDEVTSAQSLVHQEFCIANVTSAVFHGLCYTIGMVDGTTFTITEEFDELRGYEPTLDESWVRVEKNRALLCRETLESRRACAYLTLAQHLCRQRQQH